MFDIFSDQALPNLIKSVGYLGLFGIVFAESGLFFGFFLPGDSLLFTAGLLASKGILNIYLVYLTIFFAAIFGDNVGFLFGRKVGNRIFNKKESIFFHKDNILRAENFYKKYGPYTIIIARFIPIVRTFAPIVAGIGKMDYRIFVLNNIIGGLLWTITMVSAGYFLVSLFPNVEQYLNLIIVLIIVFSIIPPVFHLIKEKRQK